ncbi:acyl-CoA thioesterase [Rhizobium alarense]|uniref:acyl-CoA thioesterase n=1 Tax=Rhizobium alarense TaxID=2846851 RepID=UPI0038B52F3E
MDDRQDIRVTEIRIPFRDIDMHGHMHNAAYYAHAEAALGHLWRHRPKADAGIVYFVRKSACTFSSGLAYDDPARLAVSVTRIGATSVSFAVVISSAGRTVADVEFVWVAVDAASRQPVNLPAEIRDWLKPFQA